MTSVSNARLLAHCRRLLDPGSGASPNERRIAQGHIDRLARVVPVEPDLSLDRHERARRERERADAMRRAEVRMEACRVQREQVEAIPDWAGVQELAALHSSGGAWSAEDKRQVNSLIARESADVEVETSWMFDRLGRRCFDSAYAYRQADALLSRWIMHRLISFGHRRWLDNQTQDNKE